MKEKIANSLIYNNHFVIGIFDKWEELEISAKYLSDMSNIDKSILYLFWDKIIYEKYAHITDEKTEVPIIFNNILRIVRSNKKFMYGLYHRIAYLINVKELENDFDFIETLSLEFDDILNYLEKEYDLFVTANKISEDFLHLSKEVIDQELSQMFSFSVDYPN